MRGGQIQFSQTFEPHKPLNNLDFHKTIIYFSINKFRGATQIYRGSVMSWICHAELLLLLLSGFSMCIATQSDLLYCPFMTHRSPLSPMHCIIVRILLWFRTAIVSRGTSYMPRILFLLMESSMQSHIICAELSSSMQQKRQSSLSAMPILCKWL